ncbi:hypothetical protein BJX96DRAFT_48133 [Aspergillus floccosus]
MFQGVSRPLPPSTTPLRAPCPGSPRGLPGDGETIVPPPCEDAPETSNDERARSFRHNAYLIGVDHKKFPMQMSIDTQSTFNILPKDKAEKLGLTMEECDEAVCLLKIGSEKHKAPVEGLVQVDWHFFNGRGTYTTAFRVVAMMNFDGLLGLDDIVKYGYLTLMRHKTDAEKKKQQEEDKKNDKKVKAEQEEVREQQRIGRAANRP